MVKKVKFNGLCSEIKRSSTAGASYKEIMQCAQLVLETFEKEEVEGLETDSYDGLEQRELYEIWENDPWEIYFQEPITDSFIPYGDHRNGYQITSLVMG